MVRAESDSLSCNRLIGLATATCTIVTTVLVEGTEKQETKPTAVEREKEKKGGRKGRGEEKKRECVPLD